MRYVTACTASLTSQLPTLRNCQADLWPSCPQVKCVGEICSYELSVAQHQQPNGASDGALCDASKGMPPVKKKRSGAHDAGAYAVPLLVCYHVQHHRVM